MKCAPGVRGVSLRVYDGEGGGKVFTLLVARSIVKLKGNPVYMLDHGNPVTVENKTEKKGKG